jgi:hypothetical protein
LALIDLGVFPCSSIDIWLWKLAKSKIKNLNSNFEDTNIFFFTVNKYFLHLKFNSYWIMCDS